MFQPIVKKSELISDLTNLYGSKITTADVKGYCASHGYKYYTITRYLKEFKVTRGKWNLKVTLQRKLLRLKNHLKHPLHYLQHNNPLFLLKMILSSSLVVFKTLKRLFSLVFFILLLSLVSLEMVKHFL